MPIGRSPFSFVTCGGARSACRDPDRRAGRRLLLGQHAIWRQVSGRHAVEGLTSAGAWMAFALLVTLIAADNLLWRVAELDRELHLPCVTGDMRCDLFRHLTGHAPSYFAERLPGTLTSRITATSNAVFTIENMFIWNVMPPCVATLVAIAWWRRSAARWQRAWWWSPASWCSPCSARRAPAGRCITILPTRRRRSTARWSTSSATCRSSGRSAVSVREHRRFDATVEREMATRRRSLFYLEKAGAARARDVVLTSCCSPGRSSCGSAAPRPPATSCWSARSALGILHATRDLAVALVDVTQHMARFPKRSPPCWCRTSCATIPRRGRWRAARRERRVRERRLPLSRRPARVRNFKPQPQRRPARRSGRAVGRRQVDDVRAAAALLRRALAGAS